MALVSRGVQLARCLALIRLEASSFLEVGRLKNCHPRTVHRDCLALKEAGWNVEITGNWRNGSFRIFDGWRLKGDK